MIDRLVSAALGALSGLLLGAAGWWLYGLAHSLNYPGPALDPALRHWLVGAGGLFGVAGLLLKDRLGEILWDVLSAVFHFEIASPDRSASSVAVLLVLALSLAVLWHSTPLP